MHRSWLPNERTTRILASLGVWLLLAIGTPSAAQIKSDLSNPYLDREFDWAMFVQLRHIRGYLNYPHSKLSPITEARINFRPISRKLNATKIFAELYEEFWYHEGTPIGLKRNHQISLSDGATGIIVFGTSDGEGNYTATIGNVLVRLIMDVEAKNAVAGVVMVPRESYDQIASELGHYGFYTDSDEGEEHPPSIHLRSYPKGRDSYLFTRNQ